MSSRWGEPVPRWKLSTCWIRIRGALCQEGSFFRSFFGPKKITQKLKIHKITCKLQWSCDLMSSTFSPFLGQIMTFSVEKNIAKFSFPSKTKSQNWVEIKFQRNIWGQLDVRTRMRASKSWNFDLEKPIKPIKMDSCVIFADHCSSSGECRLIVSARLPSTVAWDVF